jgi:hypothetical protein
VLSFINGRGQMVSANDHDKMTEVWVEETIKFPHRNRPFYRPAKLRVFLAPPASEVDMARIVGWLA